VPVVRERRGEDASPKVAIPERQHDGFGMKERSDGMENTSPCTCSIFVVHAERWGDNNNHSYICGWSPDEAEAREIADTEAAWRGGKYAGVVYRVDRGRRGDCVEVYRAKSMAE